MSSARSTVPGSAHLGRAVVVDDDIQLLRIYTRILSAARYDVTATQSAREVLELIKHGEYDVVISDISMPEMSGLELLREIRNRHTDIPVIIMTAQADVATASNAVELGALRYLAKPVPAEKLCAAVNDAVFAYHEARRRTTAVARMNEQADSLLAHTELKKTFARGIEQAWMAYQPIVSYRAREVFGHEALLRTKESKIAGPDVFLDMATELDGLDLLGRTVRRSVAQKLADTGHEGTVFVNLHTHDLLDDDLFFAGAPLSQFAKQVVLEITERAGLSTVPDLSNAMLRLRELGYRIAIDDLGAGYAGLASFAAINPDIVKIDMSLIRNVHRSPINRKLVQSMTTLCHDMGLVVVAEGIETTEEREVIDEIGCDLMQGYLFYRPNPELAVISAIPF
jgi:EAL domain-containing protein (putative c-di-GMP-specific phosphodiesterase class I)